MKYIDADMMIAFLGKEKAENIIGGDYSDGVLDACDNILAFIDSLQQEQPEVDLDAEITKENERWTCYEEIGFGAKYDARPFDGRDITRIARHFYELGLNARKEE